MPAVIQLLLMWIGHWRCQSLTYVLNCRCGDYDPMQLFHPATNLSGRPTTQVVLFVGVQLDMEVAAPAEVAIAERTAAAHGGGASRATTSADDGMADADAAPAPMKRADSGTLLPRAGPGPLVAAQGVDKPAASPAAAAQEAAEHFSALSGGKLRTASAPAVADRRSVDSLLPPGQAPKRPPLDRSKAFESFLSSQSFGEAGTSALPTISESGSMSHSVSREFLVHKGTVGAGALRLRLKCAWLSTMVHEPDELCLLMHSVVDTAASSRSLDTTRIFCYERCLHSATLSFTSPAALAVRVAVRSLCSSGGLRRSFDDQHLPGTPAGGMRPLNGLTNTQRMSSAPA